MKGITRLLKPYFVKNAESTLRAADKMRVSQELELKKLLDSGRRTYYGHKYKMGRIGGYNEFRVEIPVIEYPDIREEVMRMIRGEKDILWPGRTYRFAQSSGTSDGKSKYIPVTDDSLKINHYRGGKESISHYLRNNPNSRLFDGKAFILGGSFANELEYRNKKLKVGDLSANLIDAINPLVNLIRVPRKETALMSDWEKKLIRLVDEASKEDVTNISGVPSWFLTVLQKILRDKGSLIIQELWPNLEVFFHGGIAFGPYREQYNMITDRNRMHYHENYNASEGFLAVQTDADAGMMLLPNAGVFFEFIPIGEDHGEAIPSWEVKRGGIYSLVITACNGLWRYKIGDLVRIEEDRPLKITIAGRTKHYINAFGEEVMVYNTDKALEKACKECGCHVLNYTVAPVFSNNGQKGRHEWMIEFSTLPKDLEKFARILDLHLQDENSDYQAKRQSNIFLDCLSITVARKGLFDNWLGSHGKLGGQRKVPRLSNDRKIMDELLDINN